MEKGDAKLGRVCPQKSSLMHYRGKKGEGEVEGKRKDSALPVFWCFQGMSFWSCRSMAMLSATAPPSSERLGKHCRKSQECRITVFCLRRHLLRQLRTTATTTCCVDASTALAAARSAVTVEDIAAAWHLCCAASRRLPPGKRLRDRVGVSSLASPI